MFGRATPLASAISIILAVIISAAVAMNPEDKARKLSALHLSQIPVVLLQELELMFPQISACFTKDPTPDLPCLDWEYQWQLPTWGLGNAIPEDY